MSADNVQHGWLNVPIGSLCKLVNGRAFKPTDWQPDGLPIIRIQNLNKPDAPFNRFPGAVERKYYVRTGDLLFAWSGTPGTSFGAHVWTRGDAILNQHIFNVLYDSEKVDRDYFKLAINHRLDELIAQAHGGAGLAHITKGRFEATEVPLPPLPEQRRIVARIEALFARTRRARADLQRIAPLSSAYVEAETDRAYDYGTKAGWHVSAAGELCDIKSGVTLGKRYAADAELVDRPYLRVANVQRGHLRLDEIKTVRLSAAEADRLTLRPGDVLMNEGGDRDKLGRGWVWSGEIPGCVHQNHVFRLRLRDGRITPRYLSRYANHAGARYFLGEGKQTTNLASISMSKVAALPVPVPPQGEAARIDRKLDAVSNSAAQCEQEATRALALLDRLERSILARAFRGELVPQDASEHDATLPATPPAATKPGKVRKHAHAT